jgi:hypothetical protein
MFISYIASKQWIRPIAYLVFAYVATALVNAASCSVTCYMGGGSSFMVVLNNLMESPAFTRCCEMSGMLGVLAAITAYGFYVVGCMISRLAHCQKLETLFRAMTVSIWLVTIISGVMYVQNFTML